MTRSDFANKPNFNWRGPARYTGRDIAGSRLEFTHAEVEVYWTDPACPAPEHDETVAECICWQGTRLTPNLKGAWSNRDLLPEIGQRVYCVMNGLGWCTVIAWFMEAGYIGVEVALETPPAWFTRQHSIRGGGTGRTNALLFGCDIIDTVPE